MDLLLPDGWTPRDRPFPGPGSTLQRLDGPNGMLGLAVQVRFDLADHPMMRDGMDHVAEFVTAPGVSRVLPLLYWERDTGLFIYEIGDGLLLAEVLEQCVEAGVVPGERAAIELLGLVALVLDAAARAAAQVGVFNHGSLNPWRIVVYPDGDVAIVGYAVPPIEVSAWLDEETDEPPGPGFRYTPPERIQEHDGTEDVRADLYSLGMVSAEMALGRHILSGGPREMVDQILGEEAIVALDELSGRVRRLLEQMLSADPSERPLNGADAANDASALLRTLRGHTLGGLARGAFDDDAVIMDEGMAFPPLLYTPLGEDPYLFKNKPPQEPEDDDEDVDDPPTELFADASEPEATGDVMPAATFLESTSPEAPPADAMPAVPFLDEPASSPDLAGPLETSASHDEAPLADLAMTPVPTDEHEAEFVGLAETEPSEHVDDVESSVHDVDPDSIGHAVIGMQVPREIPARQVREWEAPPRESILDTMPEAPAPAFSLFEVSEASDAPPRPRDASLPRFEAVRIDEGLASPPTTTHSEQAPSHDPSDGPELLEPKPLAPARISLGPGPALPESPSTSDIAHPKDPPRVSAARAAWPDAPDQLLLRHSKVDLSSQQVLPEEGEPEALSDIQTKVLAYLAARPGRDISLDELWHSAMAGKQGSPDSLKGILSRLRDKIEGDPNAPDHLLDADNGAAVRFVAGQSSTLGPPPLPEPDGLLFGRDEELRRVNDAMMDDEVTIVSVVGPPGSGASEVALRAAKRMQSEAFEVHRCLVGGPQSIAATLAPGLGVRSLQRAETEVLAAIGQLMSEREDLVVFLDAPRPHRSLRPTVEDWLSQGPSGLILVAARSALGLPGERVIRLGPLNRDDAVELFRRRVAKYRPGAEVSRELAEQIADQADLMPVTIESLAAQAAYHEPERLLEQLGAGTMDLEVGGGLASNLDAAIEELDEAERAVLKQAIVFKDGFDLASAERIIELPEGETRSMMSLAESLEARSLLRSVSTRGASNTRWNLYETVRAHLHRAGSDVIDEAEWRHSKRYGELGLKHGSGPWAERPDREILQREQDNLRAALQRGGPHAAGAALGLTAILGRESVGPLGEAVNALLDDEALKEGAIGADAEDDARTWWSCARIALARIQLYLGQLQRARSTIREAQAEVPTSQVRLLIDAAWIHAELGSTFGTESALHRVTTGDEWLLGVMALLKGRGASARGDTRTARRAYVEALHGFSEIGADVGAAHCQRHLAEVIAAQGQAPRATTQLEEARSVFESVADAAHAIRCRVRVAELLVGLGRLDEAEQHLTGVVKEARQVSANGLLALARGVMGALHTMRREWTDAERMFFLALAGSAPEHNQIQAWFALNLFLFGDADNAHEEARAALPHPIAASLCGLLERQPPPHDHDEAFSLFEALEAWQAYASMERFKKEYANKSSVAMRMVLEAKPRGSELAT